jgi:hypothetical protein
MSHGTLPELERPLGKDRKRPTPKPRLSRFLDV